MTIRPKAIVPTIGEPDIDESYIRQQDAVLLETLLIDRTMTALNGGSTVNIKWAVDDYAQEHPGLTGYGCEDQKFPPDVARRFAEIISWNIWQMDGIKFVVPNTCGKKKDMLGSSIECAGCAKNNVKLHDGLAFALSYMKEVEGWGGGVARYFSDWTTAGLPRPKLEETPGFFKVVFDRKRKANEPLNEPLNEPANEPVKMAVVREIRKSPGISRPALMRVIGKSRATMTRILSELVERGIIEHRGSDKTGGYFPTASAHKEAK